MYLIIAKVNINKVINVQMSQLKILKPLCKYSIYLFSMPFNNIRFTKNHKLIASVRLMAGNSTIPKG